MRKQDRALPPANCAQAARTRGATVLETVVVLAIIVLFAGVVAPEVKNYFVRSKAAKICAVYQMVAKGAMDYWADTGKYAFEDSASPNEADHSLFYKPQPHMPGWSGAYITHPLSVADNPFKMRVRLEKNIQDATAIGFDLDHDQLANGYEVGGSGGNALVFEFDPTDSAVDAVITEVEKALEKDGFVDFDAGRVKKEGTKLLLFIFQMP